MSLQNSYPDPPPSNSPLSLDVPLSSKECLAKKHSVDVGRSLPTHYFPHQKPFSQSPLSSFSISQPRIKYAQLLLKHSSLSLEHASLKRDFDALMYKHAALLRAQSAH